MRPEADNYFGLWRQNLVNIGTDISLQSNLVTGNLCTAYVCLNICPAAAGTAGLADSVIVHWWSGCYMYRVYQVCAFALWYNCHCFDRRLQALSIIVSRLCTKFSTCCASKLCTFSALNSSPISYHYSLSSLFDLEFASNPLGLERRCK